MIITVIGLGFVGLTAAVGFAERGHIVYGIDQDKTKVDIIKKGEVPFYEPGIKPTLKKVLDTNLFVTEKQSEIINQSECVFYCVGTPVGDGGNADLSFLLQAIRETLSFVSDEKRLVFAIKSTVPPGTVVNIVKPLLSERAEITGGHIEVASNPEFLREGRSWDDFMNPDRIVIGTESESAFRTLKNVYKGFDAPLEKVSPTTAEFIKYLSNTMLASMISFSNEMALTAASIGNIDIKKAFTIIHDDKRWQENTMRYYMYPGCGYGGYCLPKDTKALYYTGVKNGAQMPVLKAVIETNSRMASFVADCLMDRIDKKAAIGILGLSFKPGTDDVRDAPSARIIKCLLEKGIRNIVAYDPMAEHSFSLMYPEYPIHYPGSINALLEQCDCAAILTAWEEFKPLAKMDKVLDFRFM